MAYYSKCILLIILIFSGVVAIIATTSLTFMEGTLPGEGFFPITLGVFLFSLCLIEFVDVLKKRASVNRAIDLQQIKRIGIFFIAIFVAVVVGYYFIGLIPALALFLFFSLTIWNKLAIKSAITNTIVIITIIYLIFSVWLNVQMPWGILGS